MYTLPDGIAKHRSRNICTSGLVGYRKLTWWNAISALKFSNVVPEMSFASILDFWSRIANTEAAEHFALPELGTKEPDWEIDQAVIARVKKTCGKTGTKRILRTVKKS